MPRAGLSREKVVSEAAALADEVGLDQLSMAGLANRLGVRMPSLYKHVESLAALRRGIAVTALGELGDRLSAAAVGRSGREAVSALADAYREYAHRHPGRYPATLPAPRAGDPEHAAAADRVLGVVSAALAGYHLDGPGSVDAIRMLRSALHGFVALEAAAGFGRPDNIDHSFARLLDALSAALSDWSSASGPPPAAPEERTRAAANHQGKAETGASRHRPSARR